MSGNAGKSAGRPGEPPAPAVDRFRGQHLDLAERQIATELGLIVPTVRIRDDLVLDQNAYVIKLRGSEIARCTVDPTKMPRPSSRPGDGPRTAREGPGGS